MSRWAEDELALLRDTSLTLAEVAERTGRSLVAVEHKAIRLGIDRSFRVGVGLKRGDDNPWTDAELELLRDVSLSIAEVARTTSRTPDAVKAMASRHGVVRRPGWSEEELALLRDTSLPLVEVARRTGKKLGSVYSEASLRGIVRGAQRGAQHWRWCAGNYAPTYRGSDWLEVRGQALERDGYTCQDCGLTDFSAQKLHVHHIIPFRFRPVNDLRWLVTLCESCHFKRPEHAWEELPAAVAAQLASDQTGDVMQL